MAKRKTTPTRTEADWLADRYPRELLSIAGERARDRKAHDRKLRLFAAACLRRVWQLLPGDEVRRAVELLERYADGLTPLKDLRQAARGTELPELHNANDAKSTADSACWTAVQLVIRHAPLLEGGVYAREQAGQRALVRELFGNPFRPAAVEPAWLTWNNATIPRLAQAIYDERAFDRLPVLADALEEAGCNDPDLLAHCRAPGPHVPGCWAVGLLVGKG